MNSIRRALARVVYSHSTRKRIVSHPTALLAQSYSTKQLKKAGIETAPPSVSEPAAGVWPRPSEIPFQVKVANSVNLIGHVSTPVQFESSSDGKHWAGTVITQNATSDSPQLWIPVVFEGDLAHIAACHLKINDYVHIAGQLTADPPPRNAIHHANVQVMVSSVNFIDLSSQTWKPLAFQRQEEATRDDSASLKKAGNSESSPWHDLLKNPSNWWDYRSQKLSKLVNPRYPDFKRKDGNLSLWLNKSSGWVLSELEGLKFDVQTPKSNYAKQGKGVESNVQTSKSKYTKQDKGVEYDVQNPKSKFVKQQKADESWKDLTENPKKWWDNRSNKLSQKSPDFKNKDTGEGLWLSNAPSWVLSKLPAAVKSEKNTGVGEGDTLLS